MSERDRFSEIELFLKELGLVLVSPIRKSMEDDEEFIVSIQVSVDSRGRQTPSIQKIKSIEEKLEIEFAAMFKVVLFQEGSDHIQNGVEAILHNKFPEEIVNVFSRIKNGRATLWIKTKVPSSPDRTKVFSEAIKTFLGEFDITLKEFINVSEMNFPSQITCLSIIRRKAPISLKALDSELRVRNFSFPDKSWLQNMLDRCRKKGLILYQSRGTYVMTLLGLKALSTAKNRRSADIVRALDLNKMSGIE